MHFKLILKPHFQQNLQISSIPKCLHLPVQKINKTPNLHTKTLRNFFYCYHQNPKTTQTYFLFWFFLQDRVWGRSCTRKSQTAHRLLRAEMKRCVLRMKRPHFGGKDETRVLEKPLTSFRLLVLSVSLNPKPHHFL